MPIICDIVDIACFYNYLKGQDNFIPYLGLIMIQTPIKKFIFLSPHNVRVFDISFFFKNISYCQTRYLHRFTVFIVRYVIKNCEFRNLIKGMGRFVYKFTHLRQFSFPEFRPSPQLMHCEIQFLLQDFRDQFDEVLYTSEERRKRRRGPKFFQIII